MSHYYTRYCATHGEWDEDVDNPQEACPTCIEQGLFKTRAQLEADYDALRAERDALREDRDYMVEKYNEASRSANAAEAKLAGGVVVNKELRMDTLQEFMTVEERRSFEKADMAPFMRISKAWERALVLQSVNGDTAATGEKG